METVMVSVKFAKICQVLLAGFKGTFTFSDKENVYKVVSTGNQPGAKSVNPHSSLTVTRYHLGEMAVSAFKIFTRDDRLDASRLLSGFDSESLVIFSADGFTTTDIMNEAQRSQFVDAFLDHVIGLIKPY